MSSSRRASKCIGMLGPGCSSRCTSSASLTSLLFVACASARMARHWPVIYKGFLLERGHRLDLVVEERFIVEVKAAFRLLPVHEVQVTTYLKLTGLTTALLVNLS